MYSMGKHEKVQINENNDNKKKRKTEPSIRPETLFSRISIAIYCSIKYLLTFHLTEVK